MFNSCTGGGVKIANLRQLSIPFVFLSMLLHVGEQMLSKPFFNHSNTVNISSVFSAIFTMSTVLIYSEWKYVCFIFVLPLCKFVFCSVHVPGYRF